MTENVHQISERNLLLAREYSSYAQEYSRLRKDKGIKWLEIRTKSKTDKEATMNYESTEPGRREIELTYLMKGIEKELSAARAHLRVLDIFGN